MRKEGGWSFITAEFSISITVCVVVVVVLVEMTRDTLRKKPHNVYISALALVGSRHDLLTENTYCHYQVPRRHYVDMQSPIFEALKIKINLYLPVNFWLSTCLVIYKKSATRTRESEP